MTDKREGLKVNAVVKVERSMAAEDRVTRLESDMGELKGDVKALNARLGDWIVASAKESGSLRAEMERGFGELKTEIERSRTDTEKGFGVLRTEIEKSRADAGRGFGTLKTSIESAKLWMLVTGVGSVILATFVTFLGHALKLL